MKKRTADADGGRRTADGGRRTADGGWRMADGGWRMADGGRLMADSLHNRRFIWAERGERGILREVRDEGRRKK